MKASMSKQRDILSFILVDLGAEVHLEDLACAVSTVGAALKGDVASLYTFINVKGSPHSFELEHDVEWLEKNNVILRNGAISVLDKNALLSYGYRLPFEVQDKIRKAVIVHKTKSTREECSGVFPIKDAPSNVVYTIGYEGQSIDSFMKKVVASGVRRIVDVRCNPVSRKYGFSKKTLSSVSNKLGLEYLHFPELGIPRESRQNLHSQNDYDKLFDEYERDILSTTEDAQDRLIRELKKSASVLLCYEENCKQCHRYRLAKAVANKSGMRVVNL
jgi:hypothetical protein